VARAKPKGLARGTGEISTVTYYSVRCDVSRKMKGRIEREKVGGVSKANPINSS
jgi:hypothetical protein